MAWADDDCAEDVLPRGWRMRRGHRARLARGRSSQGRAAVARSVNDGVRRRSEERRAPKRSGRTSLRAHARREAAEHGGAGGAAALLAEASAPAGAILGDAQALETAEVRSAGHDDDRVGAPPPPAEARPATPWERAQAVAEAAARAFALEARGRPGGARAAAQPARREVLPTRGTTAAPATAVASQVTRAGPQYPDLHDAAAAFALARDHKGLQPRRASCGRSEGKGAARRRKSEKKSRTPEGPYGAEVSFESDEFAAVTRYFVDTLGSRGEVRVRSLTRLRNAQVYRRYAPHAGYGETLMFHGCKTAQNEASIIRHGFKVGHCRSGGANYGSWFAYNAYYSNEGFVYTDNSRVRHIFVCMVANTNIRLNDDTMRVVGQDCAYPVWLLKYDFPSRPAVVDGTSTQLGNIFSKQLQPDGRWVLAGSAPVSMA